MSLCELLQNDLKEARIARADNVKIDVLKMVVNRFQTEAKNSLRVPTDEDGTKAVNYYLKGAQETVTQMNLHGLANDPRYAVAVQEVIQSLSASDIGSLMKSLRAQYGTAFDAKAAKDMFLAEAKKKG